MIDFSQLHILIVDDEVMLRSVIVDFLSLMGVSQLDSAEDGQEALDKLRAQPADAMFDCIISDIRMPRMELSELLQYMGEEFPGVSVIATSGFSDMQSACEIFEKGAHDFLGKPLNLDQLEEALTWTVQRQALLSHAQTLTGAPSPTDYQTFQDQLYVVTGVVQSKMQHAARVGRLACAIETGMKDQVQNDLRLMAHLHEIGTGIQVIDLCHEARELADDERRLVRMQGNISGRIVAHTIGRPDLKEIIASHSHWGRLARELKVTQAVAASPTIWLGLLNAVDGYLTPRADRPALTTDALKQLLETKLLVNAKLEGHPLLGQWNIVERMYPGL